MLILRKKQRRIGVRARFGRGNRYREFVGNEAGSGAEQKLFIPVMWIPVANKWRSSTVVEYEAGESLDIEGYVLKSVTPITYLIVNRNTGGELSIPIQE